MCERRGRVPTPAELISVLLKLCLQQDGAEDVGSAGAAVLLRASPGHGSELLLEAAVVGPEFCRQDLITT